mmetsp:Transcript_36057/g.41797  ORF Transcript_36057/g.41797 Transcript_36057/m.41797 type:complete len:816 (+) Transcript_36057:335-2782(+)|eukprot:CAMPEP_0194383586 /NCGR_PEP_ID=MMETSP0174-20130528/68210_1 /TAXON_ID=216777 /ORGANISM="Proboscia alata, Strain PI-D3" /LENGTH=815 /DNA_ID=CAMNT_0039169935 /DNA_START=223 /DNA_END=2670 /DNA_ORIENTATION=+
MQKLQSMTKIEKNRHSSSKSFENQHHSEIHVDITCTYTSTELSITQIAKPNNFLNDEDISQCALSESEDTVIASNSSGRNEYLQGSLNEESSSSLLSIHESSHSTPRPDRVKDRSHTVATIEASSSESEDEHSSNKKKIEQNRDKLNSTSQEQLKKGKRYGKKKKRHSEGKKSMLRVVRNIFKTPSSSRRNADKLCQNETRPSPNKPKWSTPTLCKHSCDSNKHPDLTSPSNPKYRRHQSSSGFDNKLSPQRRGIAPLIVTSGDSIPKKKVIIGKQHTRTDPEEAACVRLIDGIDIISFGTVRPFEPETNDLSYSCDASTTSSYSVSCEDIIHNNFMTQQDIVFEGYRKDQTDRWAVRILSAFEEREIQANNSPPLCSEKLDDTLGSSCNDQPGERSTGPLRSNNKMLHAKHAQQHKQKKILSAETNCNDCDDTGNEMRSTSLEKVSDQNSPSTIPRMMSATAILEPTLSPMTSPSCPVDLDEDIFIINNIAHLQSVHDMAAEHLKHGRFDDTLEVFEKILRSHKNKFCDDHYLVGATLHNIGILHLRTGKYNKAIAVLKNAVRVRRLCFGPEDLINCVSLVKLGVAYFALCKLDEALQCFNNALLIQKMAESSNLITSKILNNIACVYYKVGDGEESINKFREAREVQRQELSGAVRGISTLLVAATTSRNLGRVYMKTANMKNSMKALNEALSLQSGVLRKDDIVVMDTLSDLAMAHSKKGTYEQALQIYTALLRLQATKFGPLTIEGAETLGMMSLIFIQQCRYKDALRCLEGVLACQKNHVDNDHPALVSTQNAIREVERVMILSDESLWV